MSDDTRWGQEYETENADTDVDQDVSGKTQDSSARENTDKDVTYHYRYTRGEGNQRDVIAGNRYYSAEATGQSQTGYAHYQVQPQQDVETENRPHHRRRNRANGSDFAKKLKTTVAFAVIFGLTAGVVFQAVNRVSDQLLGSREEPTLSVGMAEKVEDTAVSKSLEEEPTETVSSSAGAVAAVAKTAMPSVVAITSVSMQEIQSFFGYGMEYPSTGSGSGIIVGENEDELLIATNNHVVDDATTLSVFFIGSEVVSAEEAQNYVGWDGEIYGENNAVSAKIKGTDEENDLAVIAVQKSDIPKETMEQIKIAQIGNSDELEVGEQVVAIGNALGYGQSLTAGYVSALDRMVTLGSGTTAALIQTDAAINPGNSGGALLNLNGELIGINCAKIASSTVEGTGYAIPISKAQPILENLMSLQTRDKVQDESKAAYLGVRTADLSNEAIQMYNMPAGAFVMEVIPGEAAYYGEIHKNDIIVKMDGQKIASRSDLNNRLQYYEAGEVVEFVVARAEDGEYREKTLTVTLGSKAGYHN